MLDTSRVKSACPRNLGVGRAGIRNPCSTPRPPNLHQVPPQLLDLTSRIACSKCDGMRRIPAACAGDLKGVLQPRMDEKGIHSTTGSVVLSSAKPSRLQWQFFL